MNTDQCFHGERPLWRVGLLRPWWVTFLRLVLLAVFEAYPSLPVAGARDGCEEIDVMLM